MPATWNVEARNVGASTLTLDVVKIGEENTMGARLTHITLHVSALDACVRFYQRYCNFKVIDDQVKGEQRVVCMAESGRESEFVLQLFSGGEDKAAAPEAYHHFGFAVDSRAAVDDAIAKGREEGILIGEPEDGPFPTGYFCGLNDPNGNNVEISYGHLTNPAA